MKKQKPKLKSLKSLKSALWKLVSEYVRRHGADWRGWNTCFTCGAKIHWKKLNAGHFKHNKLDFDLRNLKPQCVKCNLWGRGKLDVYGVKLVRQFGIDWVEQLEKDAARFGNGYSRPQLVALTEEFKQKLKTIK